MAKKECFTRWQSKECFTRGGKGYGRKILIKNLIELKFSSFFFLAH
jgi:hypothetical protein